VSEASPPTYPITCSGAADDNYSFVYAPGALTITKKQLTVTADNQSRQYSDPSPPLTFQYSGGFVTGFAAGSIDTPPTCTTTRTTTSAPSPPTSPITCSAGADDNYSFSYVNGVFTVTQEDARATYTGPMLVFTPPGGSSATIALKAAVLDATAAPALDPDAGNISNATVTFKDGSTTLCTATVVLDSPADIKVGTASCTGTLTGLDAHTINVFVNNYYVGTTQAVVEVAQPDGNFITGGGYLTMTNSAGTYAATTGSRMNYGFNVKYNKGSKPQPQGHVNVIFRVGTSVYQIKSTSIDVFSLGFAQACTGPPSSTCWGISTFESKANLSNVTNPASPTSLGGGFKLVVTLTDKGEPGSSDSFSIQLSSNSQLLFSSNWTGTKTVEKLISGGNLVVH
jgi:hypothetical protein